MRINVFIEAPDNANGEKVLSVVNAVRLAMRDSHPDCQMTGYELEPVKLRSVDELGRVSPSE